MPRPGETLERYLLEAKLFCVAAPQRRLRLACIIGQLIGGELAVDRRAAFTVSRIADCTDTTLLSARTLTQHLYKGGYIEELPHDQYYKAHTANPTRSVMAAYWPYAPVTSELGQGFMAAARQDAEAADQLQCTDRLLERETPPEALL
jgi:hypothetical protein